MRFTRTSRMVALTALFAVCAFAGDIVADSVADLRGDHCVSQSSQPDSQHEKAPCGHCSCAVHNGTVITSAVAIGVVGALEYLSSFRSVTNPRPTVYRLRSIIRLS